MKMVHFVFAGLFLAPQFLCHAHAIELCEPQDYYNLAHSTKCKIEYNKGGNKSDSRELMFEILENYPYEKKDRIMKLLQRKIELVDRHITQQQGLQTEKTKVNISKLQRTRQDLLGQKVMVIASTRDNWVRVRDQARKSLEEAAIRLREVE